MDACRQAMINNSTFENEEQDIIGKAVSKWTVNYNKKHIAKTSSVSLQEESTYVFTLLLTIRYIFIVYLFFLPNSTPYIFYYLQIMISIVILQGR